MSEAKIVTHEAGPIVLVVGATGQLGKLIVEELQRDAGPQQVRVRVPCRRREQVEQFKAKGLDAVLLDLDEPKTFADALLGVERLFLLTGYTVAMLAQSKTLIDAAKKAGVKHIVHLGTFGEWDVTVDHFAWHQMIECYVEANGFAWTHLHPNFFMQNLIGATPVKDGVLTMYMGSARLGWVALEDVAAVAATVFREGPQKHRGQHYWMSTEALTGDEAAAIIAKVTGKSCRCQSKKPEQFLEDVMASGISIEPVYAAGGAAFLATGGRRHD